MPYPALGDHELNPRGLRLTQEATSAWRAFADELERSLGPDGGYSSVRGLCNKIAEMALRIAGVLTLADDPGAQVIGLDVFNRACALANYHLGEARRLYDANLINPEILKANRLLQWLVARSEIRIPRNTVQKMGPNALRDAKALDRAVSVLVEYGWLRVEVERSGGKPKTFYVLSPYAHSEFHNAA